MSAQPAFAPIPDLETNTRPCKWCGTPVVLPEGVKPHALGVLCADPICQVEVEAHYT